MKHVLVDMTNEDTNTVLVFDTYDEMITHLVESDRKMSDFTYLHIVGPVISVAHGGKIGHV